ncbi:MAG: hypothetical protein IPK58_19180 [Acidobacteria bacterium]|nr:hypothetical protein [Acidobacteriota bacterium]
MKGITPASMVRGDGSVGFEKISPYSGGMTLAVPLLSVGGRGNAGYQLTARISPKWSVTSYSEPQDGSTPIPLIGLKNAAPYDIANTFEPGRMVERHAGDEPTCNQPTGVFVRTVTYFTFVFADGSEMNFYDDTNKGATLAQNCLTPTTYNRGAIFYSTGGEGATLILDQPAYDHNNGYSAEGSFGERPPFGSKTE